MCNLLLPSTSLLSLLLVSGPRFRKSRVTPSFLQNSLGGGSPPALHEKYKFPPGTTSVSPGIVRKKRLEYNAGKLHKLDNYIQASPNLWFPSSYFNLTKYSNIFNIWDLFNIYLQFWLAFGCKVVWRCARMNFVNIKIAKDITKVVKLLLFVIVDYSWITAGKPSMYNQMIHAFLFFIHSMLFKMYYCFRWCCWCKNLST